MAVHSLGATLSVNGQVIGEVTQHDTPKFEREMKETTTLSTPGGARTYSPTFVGFGTISGEGYFANDAGQAALETLLLSGASATFVITYPAAQPRTETFQGFVKSLTKGINFEEMISFSFEIQITGLVTPSTGTNLSSPLSGLSVVTSVNSTGVTAFANPSNYVSGTYFYSVTTTTNGSVTVTPTLTGMTGTARIISNGDPSTAVNLGVVNSGTLLVVPFSTSGQVKVLEIEYSEGGKIPRTYQIQIIKT